MEQLLLQRFVRPDAGRYEVLRDEFQAAKRYWRERRSPRSYTLPSPPSALPRRDGNAARLRCQAMSLIKDNFRRFDGPTWLVALAAVRRLGPADLAQRRLPWWVIMPVGAYLRRMALLVAARGHPFVSRRARAGCASRRVPAVGLVVSRIPYIARAIPTHHRDINLTIPGVDTESYYVFAADWERMGPIKRALADVQPNHGGPFDHRTARCAVESRHQGNSPRAPGRSDSPAALGACTSSPWRPCSGSFPGSAAFPWWQYCLARRLPGLEPWIAARLYRTPRRRRLARANRGG